jgi:glycosyltransferase involved in cell wall biosynthesis
MSSVGPSRNVVNLARALSQWADVAVAFRGIADSHLPDDVRVLEIQPGRVAATTDDAAMQGIGFGEFLSFMHALRRFVHNDLRTFDVVLEKSWLLSGYVSAMCRRRGQLGVPIENIVVNPSHAARRQPMKLVRLRVGHWLAGRAIRGAPLIIAETEFLRKEIAQFWAVAPERISVIGLGVDRGLFRPLDQNAARRRLAVSTDKTILAYVGVLDYTHNLEPCIRALGMVRRPDIELHIIGDGMRRTEYANLAAATGTTVIFHGRVQHQQVPWHIASADLCLAPYDVAAFSSGELGYSTMKIPEYLSVGRPVASVPSGRIRTLVNDNETGFLFNNESRAWAAFLRDLPGRERLRAMGAAAARVILPSWEDTARAYLSICEQQLEVMRRARS